MRFSITLRNKLKELQDRNFKVKVIALGIHSIECDFGSTLFQGPKAEEVGEIALSLKETFDEENTQDCILLAHYPLLEQIRFPIKTYEQYFCKAA